MRKEKNRRNDIRNYIWKIFLFLRLLHISAYLCHHQAQVKNIYIYKLVEALRYKPEVIGLDSRWCHWNFSLTVFRPHYGSGADSASNENEYQEYFLGAKAAGA